MIFNIGDLVHIPQDVVLFNETKTNTHCTKKPLTAVVVKSAVYENYISVYIKGEELHVQRRDVYPMGEETRAN
jgi:hypothetical protein